MRRCVSLKSSQLSVLTSDTYPLGIFLLFISFVSFPSLFQHDESNDATTTVLLWY